MANDKRVRASYAAAGNADGPPGAAPDPAAHSHSDACGPAADETPEMAQYLPAEGDDAAPRLTPAAALQGEQMVFVTSTRQSFAAASAQFNALSLFGAETARELLIGDRLHSEDKAKARENAFLTDRAFAVDQHGDLRNYLDYAAAVAAIQAKAAALGYGAQSTAVPIDTVPGGYVGRYGGNDIYAAAK